MFLVGLTGVALLSSLISGLLSHPRIFKDAFALRWGGSRRLQEADLHNRLGVWGLPFHIVVSLTGALLGLSTLIVGVLALAAYDGDFGEAFATLLGPRASADETPRRVPDVAAMIRHVQSVKPDARFTSVHIEHVGKAGQVVHLGMRTPGHLAFGQRLLLRRRRQAAGRRRPGDGRRRPADPRRAVAAALRLVRRLAGQDRLRRARPGADGRHPQRRGHLAGAPARQGTAGAAAGRRYGRPSSGASRWRSPTGPPSPALLVEERAILPVYLATVLASFVLPACMGNAASITRVLRALTAAALAAVVLVHGLVWAPKVSDTLAWFVSLSALVAVVAIMAGAVLTRKPSTA